MALRVFPASHRCGSCGGPHGGPYVGCYNAHAGCTGTGHEQAPAHGQGPVGYACVSGPAAHERRAVWAYSAGVPLAVPNGVLDAAHRCGRGASSAHCTAYALLVATAGRWDAFDAAGANACAVRCSSACGDWRGPGGSCGGFGHAGWASGGQRGVGGRGDWRGSARGGHRAAATPRPPRDAPAPRHTCPAAPHSSGPGAHRRFSAPPKVTPLLAVTACLPREPAPCSHGQHGRGGSSKRECVCV